MRKLYVVHNAPPLLSGRAMQALMLAGSLNRRPGVEVFSISLDQRPVDAPPRSPIRMRLDVWQVRRVLLRLLWTCIRERVSAVHFHGHHYAAHLTKDALMDELRQAHYFLAISSAEGLSNAYLKCLSQGLLPICYEDRHDPLFETLDLVDDLIRVPRGDPKIASAALSQSLGRHPWSQTRAAEIQSRVAERFGLERIADRLLALYRDPTAPV